MSCTALPERHRIKWDRARWIALPLLVALLGASPAQAATSTPEAGGIGAYPLSPTCASAWLLARADGNAKELALIAYVLGPPGWGEQDSKFESQMDRNPVQFSLICGNVRIRLTCDAAKGGGTVLDRAYDLEHDNVFLITAADGDSATVRALGRHDLSFAKDANPSTELVARDRAVREALVGRPAPAPARSDAPPSPAQALCGEARQLLRTKNPADAEHACSLLAQAAESGWPEAEYGYGFCLQSGRGRRKDLAAANSWYRKAAAHGEPNAAFKLGWNSREGSGAKKDPAAALGWFRQCAASGDSVCQALVGQMLETGEGTPARLDSALAWYVRSAERGVPDAQYAVARIAAADEKCDPAAGLLWIATLEARRSQLPAAWVADLARWRPRLEQRLSPEARARVSAEANAWLIEDSKRVLERLAR